MIVHLQVPLIEEGPFFIQPKVIVAPYSTENVKVNNANFVINVIRLFS